MQKVQKVQKVQSKILRVPECQSVTTKKMKWTYGQKGQNGQGKNVVNIAVRENNMNCFSVKDSAGRSMGTVRYRLGTGCSGHNPYRNRHKEVPGILHDMLCRDRLGHYVCL